MRDGHALSDRLSAWKRRVIDVGLFVVFVVLFGKFVASEIWHAIGPLFGK